MHVFGISILEERSSFLTSLGREKMQIIRYAATFKVPNRAKYGDNARGECYINSWMEEVEEPQTQEEWDELEASIEEERLAAEKKIEEYLKK